MWSNQIIRSEVKETAFGFYSDEELKAEIEMRFNSKREDEIYLCFEVDGRHAGDARIRKIKDRKSYLYNESHGVWEFGIQCDQAYWGEVELSAIIAMFDIAFRVKRAVRVEETLWNSNAHQSDLFQSAGFCQEGVLRKRVWRNEEWLDEVVMGITDDDYVKLWGNSIPHWNFEEMKTQL